MSPVQLNIPTFEKMIPNKLGYSKNQLIIDFDNKVTGQIEVLSSLELIKNKLPFLFNSQIEDILAAEKRYETGKGYLFTNGTGTGKTFVGLGIAWRFFHSGKKNILVVVPTEKKCIDWIQEAEHFSLQVYQLQSTLEAGKNITVTTYSNFYQNSAILTRNFDLVIYDESHYLNQNLV